MGQDAACAASKRQLISKDETSSLDTAHVTGQEKEKKNTRVFSWRPKRRRLVPVFCS